MRDWIDRLANAGTLPTDSADERARKATLTLSACIITVLATVWTVTYGVLGLYLSAAAPLAYQAGSLFNLAVFFTTKRYRYFRFGQLFLILWLPFLLQWSLGGFVTSGAVMAWAILAPFGALMFHAPRQAAYWLAAFVALVGVSGAIDTTLPDKDIPFAVTLAFFVLNTSFVSGVAYFLVHYFVAARERAMKELAAAHETSERLLLNILPKPIADRLKESDGIIADGYESVTVLFADIVGFTPLAETMEPAEVVALLNEVFSAFDELVEENGLEKIKTIGDGYMVAGGLPTPREDHAEAVAETALRLREAIAEIAVAARCNLEVRMGMDSGPVVAGVIGKRKFSYDLWGDTVNIASRMESHCNPGNIQVTDRAYERLRERFAFEERGAVQIKGKGEMRAYLLLGRRGEP
jgi:class 3 adenylate cyclase